MALLGARGAPSRRRAVAAAGQRAGQQPRLCRQQLSQLSQQQQQQPWQEQEQKEEEQWEW